MSQERKGALYIYIYIYKDKVKYLPSWFDQWWILFGAETSIMPSFLSDKFESYICKE
jgi:hypothetical protein